MTVFDKHAPIKTKRVKKESQPDWYNEDIKFASKQRDMYHKSRNWPQYKHWRNKTIQLIRTCTSKKGFFAKSIAENKDNTYLWIHIKDINGKSKENKLPDELTVNGNSTTDPHIISECLNTFFSTISDKLKTENPQDNPQFETSTLDNYIKTKIPNTVQFGIPLMKMTNLMTSLKSLDVTKATGLDDITPTEF